MQNSLKAKLRCEIMPNLNGMLFPIGPGVGGDQSPVAENERDKANEAYEIF